MGLRQLAETELQLAARREAERRCGHILHFHFMASAARSDCKGAPMEVLDTRSLKRRKAVALRLRALAIGLYDAR